MNKSEFLNELEKRIRVLEKDEIKDILAEYSQHIEMRIESGLSEADAIKDFGSIDELTAEILEAYHVNPEYERETENFETLEKSIKGSEKRKGCAPLVGILVAMWIWIKKLLIGAKNGFKKLIENIKKLFNKLFGAFKKSEKKVEASEKTQRTELTEVKNYKTNNRKQIFKGAKERCKGEFKKLTYTCLVILVILCLLPVAVVGIASIFAFGFSIVFLIQGYPVIGIFIILLGLAVSSIAIGGLLISLITKTKNEETEICEQEIDDETDDLDEFRGEDEYK